MILKQATNILKIVDKIKSFSKTSGIDCLEKCFSKEHFKNYNKQISYQYNSQGFRDREWPTDLSDVVWCVGDSYTVGLGQPFEETWPQMLEKKILKRCLNIGENGCSNDTIALRALEICKLYKPKLIIIMWSYFHRRRVDNQDINFDKTNFGSNEDIKNFAKNFLTIDSLPIKKIHLTVPNPLISKKNMSGKMFYYTLSKFSNLDLNQVKKINIFNQLDYARDYHHGDVKTSEYISNLIIEKIKDLDN